MTEGRVIRFLIVMFWMLFWGLSVVDKIVPDVHLYWVGKDFFALFVKFFASLGIKESIYPTIALAGISSFEVLNFTIFLISIVHMITGAQQRAAFWFYRGALTSMILFALFSIGDQVFGDRFQLLEHGLFWLIILASWIVFKRFGDEEQVEVKLKWNRPLIVALVVGAVLLLATSISILNFSQKTFANTENPVIGEEVADGVYKFDFPFLADKIVWENTINAFKMDHPELHVNYIYTGPSELNSKKKTHMLLYVFTEKK